MQPLLISAAVAFAVFIAFLLIFSGRASAPADRRKKSALERLAEIERPQNAVVSSEEMSLLKGAVPLPTEGFLGIFSHLSFVQSTYDLLLKAGHEFKIKQFLMILAGIILVLTVLLYKLLHNFGAVSLPLSLVIGPTVGIFLVRWYLRKTIKKRNLLFVSQFPDAIDMIVRGVRSGQALSVALRMIADNMEPPVSTEFQQVIDEVAYGRPLTEALRRMATRIAEEDVHFFVVVLAVQQETGGNLSEVLGNLSGVLRKRKQLRNKIKALTSEGVMTSYILGGLPVFEFFLLYFMSPGYMDPLFNRTEGNILLAVAIGLIVMTLFIVRTMINGVAI